MMKTKKMRKKEHVKRVQSLYNNLNSSRKNEIRKHIIGLKGKVINRNFTCDICGHQRINGYLYNDENKEYEICKFCNNSIFHKTHYLNIIYTPMGNNQ